MAIAQETVADVSVGAFLSGGIGETAVPDETGYWFRFATWLQSVLDSRPSSRTRSFERSSVDYREGARKPSSASDTC